MNKFAIITDSTSDLTPEIRKARNIDYARMMVSWTDVKDKKDHEIFASLDWEVYSQHEYFNLLRDGNRLITSQVTEQEFDRVFGIYLEKGMDILYVSCSSALSASVHLAERLAKEKYSKKYPNQRVVCVDSLIACFGEGLVALAAADLRDQGKTIDETAAWLNEHKLEYNQIATVETLDYLKRAGRVKASKAFFGNIFGVKPMLISDAIGNNFAFEKQKGRRNALIRIATFVKENVINPEEQVCYVSQADASQEDVKLLVDKIKELVPQFKAIEIIPFGPIIGATTGPGTMGAFFRGKKVTVVGDN